MAPPHDSRKINICLNPEEVTTPSHSHSLTPNIIKGPYQNVNHYLDIHSRLLREDFIAPLRDGICGYMKNPKMKLENIEIYDRICFLNMELIKDELYCYRIQYDLTKQMRQSEKKSESLKFGSLLCFTNTNFKTVLFGRIIRDSEDLQQGHLIVGFDNIMELPRNLHDQKLLMVASTVYFEPYYQVLNALKRIQPNNFPMARYILNVQDVDRPPKYLLLNKNVSVLYKIENRTFCPLKWDRRIFYGLNDSQNLAFKAALSQEFSVIQGPPGTGKTFLGLKIAQTLINNNSVWYCRSPMLVICYSNHALDQFLEGLLKVTTNILRIGNRSKNEILDKFNIKEKRNKKQSFERRQLEWKLNFCRDNFAVITDTLKQIELNEGILDFSAFYNIFSHSHYKCSWITHATCSGDILDWLLDENVSRIMVQSNLQNSVISTGGGNYQIEEMVDFDCDGYIITDDVIKSLVVKPCKPLITISEIYAEINKLNDKLIFLSGSRNLTKAISEKQEVLLKLDILEQALKILKKKLGANKGANERARANSVLYDFQRPNTIPKSYRWNWYWHWLEEYRVELIARRKIFCTYFNRVYREYKKLCENEDVEIMKNAFVVGMTTSGAARLRTSLEALKSPIVIVEEAAEVLESHIICALTSHCKHLILIGDHQQLRPSTADYTIETKYKLGISLFERMFLNKVQCYTLNVQHRMRPEISGLISPSIYPDLRNHESVLNRPPVRGMDSSVYFIDHQEPEKSINTSKINVHETNFLLNLADYLILNGYESKNVVILVAYLAQVTEFCQRRKQHPLLQDIQIVTLDNYQGEESDIVLLSLVRNIGSKNNIGFLKIENRVCVALSRAKNGLYIMGNMNLLGSKSDVWSKVKVALDKQNAIGPYLTLRCQNHRHKINKVRKPEDFMKVQDGGCTLKCEYQLKCGHTCKMMCHLNDRDHARYQCTKKCKKLLCSNTLHFCQKLCYEKCGLCRNQVQHVLKCGHMATMDCYINPGSYKCIVKVNTILSCDHIVEKLCYVDSRQIICQQLCHKPVEACGHLCIISCHREKDYIKHQCKDRCPPPKSSCMVM